MPNLTYACTCGTYLQAFDLETLDCGISAHVCGPSLAALLDAGVLEWLCGLYGRGFVLRRADGSGALVRDG